MEIYLPYFLESSPVKALRRLVISLPDQLATHDPDCYPVLGPGSLLLLILDYYSNSPAQGQRDLPSTHIQNNIFTLSLPSYLYPDAHESCWLPGKVKREDKLKDYRIRKYFHLPT